MLNELDSNTINAVLEYFCNNNDQWFTVDSAIFETFGLQVLGLQS